jgi:hypothetical protein
MIYGPKDDATYVVEFMTADGDVLSISIPRSETHVIRHFQERMLYGLFCLRWSDDRWDRVGTATTSADRGHEWGHPGRRRSRAKPGGTAREQHPPTAAMNQATQGGATSPQDVQSQTRGGPTAAQQVEGARRPASEHLASAQAALEQARSFDRSGQEAQCMDAVARAKQFVR